MKAITTKYYSATIYKSARISAKAPDNATRYYPYPYELNADEAHHWAACKYRDAMGWEGELVQGWTGKEMVHVFAGSRPRMTEKQTNILRNIIDSIQGFDRECQLTEYTDTEEAWGLIYAVSAGVQSILDEA